MEVIAYILLCSLFKYLPNMNTIHENIVMSLYAFTIKNGYVIGNQSDANKPRTIVNYAFKVK